MSGLSALGLEVRGASRSVDLLAMALWRIDCRSDRVCVSFAPDLGLVRSH